MRHLLSQVIEKKQRKPSVLGMLLVPIGLLQFVDSILAFLYPVFLESVVHSPAFVGLLLSTSSMVGVCCDILFPRWFTGNPWRKQLFFAWIICFFFPITLFLGITSHSWWWFVAAAACWGIYFELQSFAQQNFVVDQEPESAYTRDWSIIYSVRMMLGLLAAAAAGWLLIQPPTFFLYSMTMLCVVGTALALIVARVLLPFSRQQLTQTHEEEVPATSISTLWRLQTALFPALAMSFLTQIVDSAFWTLGALFIIDQFGATGWESALLFAYLSATVMSSLLGIKVLPNHGKKKLSCLLAFGAGVALSGFFAQPPLVVVLGICFVAGAFFGLINPLNEAVYSDLLFEAEKLDQTILGFAKGWNSIGYILGPLILGATAEWIGYWMTFGGLGVVCILVSLLAWSSAKEEISVGKIEKGM